MGLAKGPSWAFPSQGFSALYSGGCEKNGAPPSVKDDYFMRRGWDSNPRYPLRHTRFRGERLQPLAHLSFIIIYCGEGGIRTHGTVSRTHAFQACTFNHSVTSPVRKRNLNFYPAFFRSSIV